MQSIRSNLQKTSFEQIIIWHNYLLNSYCCIRIWLGCSVFTVKFFVFINYKLMENSVPDPDANEERWLEEFLPEPSRVASLVTLGWKIAAIFTERLDWEGASRGMELQVVWEIGLRAYIKRGRKRGTGEIFTSSFMQ